MFFFNSEYKLICIFQLNYPSFLNKQFQIRGFGEIFFGKNVSRRNFAICSHNIVWKFKLVYWNLPMKLFRKKYIYIKQKSIAYTYRDLISVQKYDYSKVFEKVNKRLFFYLLRECINGILDRNKIMLLGFSLNMFFLIKFIIHLFFAFILYFSHIHPFKVR